MTHTIDATGGPAGDADTTGGPVSGPADDADTIRGPAGAGNGGTTASALRLTAAAVAMAGMVPYITLKVIWLTGGSVGIGDPALLRDGGFFGLNLLTLGMDVVALLVALAFVRPWGLRITAGAILAPMWAGTGLLVPIAVQAPLGGLFALVSGEKPIGADSPVAGWVYLVVYTGFTAQAFGLTAGFVHHARRRWPWVFAARTSDGRPGPARQAQVFVAWAALAVAVVIAVLDLALLPGAVSGLPAGLSFTAGLRGLVDALLPVLAATGLLAIVRGRSARPLWRPVALAWLGSGGMFGWSMWSLITALTPSALNPGGSGGPAALISLFTALTGLAIGLTGILTLTGAFTPATRRS
ncbi:hypothetical protein ACFYSC_23185 [Streptosporangium sp. NPDC004379]|uniref:hypothetical protein n=1 Tax=Streptosporangium sp. NPDC004379 TaxID=3366189 RepID=UPI00367A3109